jgi:hypothetical protein
MKILQVNLRLLAGWRLYLVVVGISIVEPTFAQKHSFNWSDTTFRIGSIRIVHLSRAFDGPCTVKPCYDYRNNKSVYDTIVSFLNRNQKISVAFLWHTRTIETPDYNLAISKRMAAGIIAELVRQGIDTNRLSAIGLGESMPIINEEELNAIKDHKERSHADRSNERVEIIILATR